MELRRSSKRVNTPKFIKTNDYGLYFAYGSNLNIVQMADRCPTAVPHEVATLHGYELQFRTYATVEAKEATQTQGALYWITSEDEDTLDACEGAGFIYDKHLVKVTLANGEDVWALAYITIPSARPIAPPPAEYVECIEQGYRDWKITVDKPLPRSIPHNPTIHNRKRSRSTIHG